MPQGSKATVPAMGSSNGSQNGSSLMREYKFVNFQGRPGMQSLRLIPQGASADASILRPGVGYYNNPSTFTASTPSSGGFTTRAVTVTITRTVNDATTTDDQVSSIEWFAMPPEVRCGIYRELIGDIIINVDDSVFPQIYIRRPGSSPLNSYGPPLSFPTNTSSFLAVCKRFFHELREQLWKTVKVLEFERRWDFLNAFANQSLQVNPSSNVPRGFDNVFMFPIGTDIFTKIQHLSINLTKTSDFRGIVHAAEAERVTLNILNIAKNSMPSLRKMVFIVDTRARLQDDFIVFFPSAWFLEEVLSIPHLREVRFKAGGDFRGSGVKKGANRACIWALNTILREHMEATDPYDRLTFGISGSSFARQLQIKIGRKMVALLEVTNAKHDEYWTKLHNKCNALAMNV